MGASCSAMMRACSRLPFRGLVRYLDFCIRPVVAVREEQNSVIATLS